MPAMPKISFNELKPSLNGTVIVFVDENLRLGRIAEQALAPAGNLVTRAAKGEGFKGKSARPSN